MFIDQANILVMAGAGGDGCTAMTKHPSSRHARPSGGNGGDGGNVVLVADPHLTTLLDFQFRSEFHAGRGRHGSGNTKTGKRGAECLIRVPVGTVMTERDGCLVGDFVTASDQCLVARGGRGGIGNANASRATPGQAGEKRWLRLELKLIADVGLVGFPNAGKSSLLARLSTAHPKIAAYPFTTRTPVLGVVQGDSQGAFVACDIPGLIEGAHDGRGLGIQFLRHIERTRLLLHVIDAASVDGGDPLERFHQLNHELAAYSPLLRTRPQLVVANKMDLPQAQEGLRRLQASLSEPVVAISCATKAGIPQLIGLVWQRLQALGPATVGGSPASHLSGAR